MLHYTTIEANTLSILKRLLKLPQLNSFNLAGGTALALRYGHRISVDIDLFGNNFDKDELIKALQNEFGEEFVYEHAQNTWALFCYIQNIKVDLIQYPHPIITPIEEIDGIRMLSAVDIAAMKIAAILGRASKKDFWDIHELLEHYSLDEMIRAYKTKFPNQMLLISIPQALCYFDEADQSENPISLKEQSWELVQTSIKEKVRDFLS
ncbi:MAG TPA: nucleotidyl transferase AbiEii/AbiGii toxin family protein [Fulvivirga sp.]|nr:nucleotidyl transferase AbiEii/AbiGii toxin family protein [Fulvivirga sp.]